MSGWILDKALRRLVRQGVLTVIDHKGGTSTYGSPHPDFQDIASISQCLNAFDSIAPAARRHPDNDANALTCKPPRVRRQSHHRNLRVAQNT